MSAQWNTQKPRRALAWGLGVAVLAALALATWWMLRERGAAAPPSSELPESTAAEPLAAAARGATADRSAPAAPVQAAPVVEAPTAANAAMVVSGVVVTPDGRPAVGAEVSVWRALSAWPEWSREPLGRSALTDDAGRFTIRVVRRHGLLVEFQHTEWAGGLQQVALDAGAMRLVLQPRFELSGFVRTPTGVGVPNARVSLEAVAGDQRRVASLPTAANGAYRFSGLAAGPVRVVVRHEAWMPVTVPVLVVGDVVRKDVDFERAAAAPLRGRVVDAASRAPIEGAAVQVLPAGTRPGLSDPITTRTDRDGAFTFAGLAAGSVRVLIRHPDHGALLRNLTIGTNSAEPVYAMPGRSILRGRVAAENGQTVVVEGEVLEIRDSAGQLEYATVARDGTFRFDASLSPGTATLTAVGGAFAFERTRSRETTVAVDETATNDVTLVVVAPTVVRGRAVDERGRPIVGAQVWKTRVLAASARSIGTALTQFDIGSAGSRVFQLFGGDRDEMVATTREDGTFEVKGQKPGSLTLRLAAPRLGSRWETVDVPAGSEPLVVADSVLRDGCRLEGRVMRANRPVVGASVTAVNREAQAVTTTRAGGRFVFEDLPPGEYGVRARSPSSPNGTREQRVTAASDRPPREFDLSLDAGRIVSGSVTNRSGQAIPNALVSVVGIVGQSAVTDTVGQFLLELPQGATHLQVSLADRSRTITVPVVADARSIDAQLDAPPTTTLTADIAALPGRIRPSGVLVRVTRLDDPADTETRTTWVELQNGELGWPACPVGHVRIEIWSEDHAPFVTERTLAANEPHALGPVLLEPGARLVGEVRDADEKPVANALVWLGEEADSMFFEPRTRTAADGTFRLSGVTSRSARVVVQAAGHAPRFQDLTLPRDVLAMTPLVIVVDKGATIEVQLPRDDTAMVRRVELRQRERLIAVAEVDDTGGAHFEHCAAGEYTVGVLGVDADRKVVVVERGVAVVRVSLAQ